MTLFGAPQDEEYPRKWKEMSLEFKLMFGFHICMMALFVVNGRFTFRQEIGFVFVLVAIVVIASLWHRMVIGWEWPGAGARDILSAAVGVVFITVFLAAGNPLFPISNVRFLPWYLAGIGIGGFNILQSLKLVRLSEAQMLADAKRALSDRENVPTVLEVEPILRRVVRGIYTCVFFLVWLSGVGSFYLYGKTFQSGAPSPTMTKSDTLTDHGHTVYITHEQKVELDDLQAVSAIGIPAVIISGLVLHFLLGIKLFPNTPTLAEWRAKRAAQR